jgi:hypothetical protein
MGSITTPNHYFFSSFTAGSYIDDATTTINYTLATGLAPLSGSCILYDSPSLSLSFPGLYFFGYDGSVWLPIDITDLTVTIISLFIQKPNNPGQTIFRQGNTTTISGLNTIAVTDVVEPNTYFCGAVDRSFNYDVNSTTSAQTTTAYLAYTGQSPSEGDIYLPARVGSLDIPAGLICLIYAQLPGSGSGLGWGVINFNSSAGPSYPIYNVFDPITGTYYSMAAQTYTTGPDSFTELAVLYSSRFCAYSSANLVDIDPMNKLGSYLLNTTDIRLYVSDGTNWIIVNPQPIPGNKYIISSITTRETYLVNPETSISDIPCGTVDQAMNLKYTLKGYSPCDNPLNVLEDAVNYFYQIIDCGSSSTTLPLPTSPQPLPAPGIMIDFDIAYQNTIVGSPTIQYNGSIWEWSIPTSNNNQVATINYWIGGQKHTNFYTLTAQYPSIIPSYSNVAINNSSPTPVFIINTTPGSVVVSRYPSAMLFTQTGTAWTLDNPSSVTNFGRVVFSHTDATGCLIQTWDVIIEAQNLPPPAGLIISMCSGIVNNIPAKTGPATLITPYILQNNVSDVVNLNQGGAVNAPYSWEPNTAGSNYNISYAVQGIFVPNIGGTYLYKITVVINYQYPAQVCKLSELQPRFELMLDNNIEIKPIGCGVIPLNKLSTMIDCDDSPVAVGQVVIDCLTSLTSISGDPVGSDKLFIRYNTDGLYIPITLNPYANNDVGCQTTFTVSSL